MVMRAPAAWNGERYVLTDSEELITDTNLVLKSMNITLNRLLKIADIEPVST